jgi:ABC-2 type transport system ATP-binding protein
VLGPNGAGKTTTIRMLATLLRPDGGSARVLGHDIISEADDVRARVTLTGQLASVDDDLTGRENLILLGRLLGFAGRQARARADELLGAFGLEDAAGRVVKHYSGGMRRRLDIAASIVVTPELMFLDEPTTGSTRGRATRCGTSCARSSPRARPCCCAPSTSTRPTSSPAASRSSTTAG